MNIKASSSLLLSAVLFFPLPVLWTSGIVSSGLRFSTVVLIVQLHRLAWFYFAFLALIIKGNIVMMSIKVFKPSFVSYPET